MYPRHGQDSQWTRSSLSSQAGLSIIPLVSVWLGYHGPVLGSVPVYIVIKHLYRNKKIPMGFVGDTRMLRVTDEGCLI